MNRWIRLTTKRAVWILAAGAILTIVAASWGLGVFKHLSNGGFDDPTSSSAKAAAIVAREFPAEQIDLIVLFTSHSPVLSGPSAQSSLRQDISKLAAAPGVSHVTSILNAPSPALISKG